MKTKKMRKTIEERYRLEINLDKTMIIDGWAYTHSPALGVTYGVVADFIAGSKDFEAAKWGVEFYHSFKTDNNEAIIEACKLITWLSTIASYHAASYSNTEQRKEFGAKLNRARQCANRILDAMERAMK